MSIEAGMIYKGVRQMKRFSGLVVLTFLVLPIQALGQTSQQYALMGKKLWAAFACAAVTDVIGDDAEENRLFKIGYEQGKAFLDAVKSGKVEQKDLNNEVPLTLVYVLKGPNADFILGRIWEAVIDEVTKDIFAIDDKVLQKNVARRKYAQMNCSLM
jgi:hypothetical protein